VEDVVVAAAGQHDEVEAHVNRKRVVEGLEAPSSSSAEAAASSSKRSRRGQPVDYAALNAKLEAEAASSEAGAQP
jgi:hypothetical protein